MVLQRDKPVPVWGEAAPQESVTVEFAGQRVATTADANGRWAVRLAAMPARAEPRTLATPNLVNAAGLPVVPFRTDDWPVTTTRPHVPKAPGAELVRAFTQPPRAARAWVFWYWMQAAVSREGITRDLAAMKEAGISGAYIFAIRGPANPPLMTPPVVQLSPAWWDAVRFAFSEADRLGIRLAWHMGDGFATAGGPWVTPELSMQKVVWSETQVEGGQTVELAVAAPPANHGFYRDVAVYAYPAVSGAGATSRTKTPVVSTSLPGPAPQFLAGEAGTEVFRGDRACWIQYAFAEPFTSRSLTVRLPPAPNAYQPNTYHANRLAVEVSDDGRTFRRVAQLVPPRHGWQDGDADITHALPEVTAKFYRFVFDPAGAEPAAEDLDSAKWKPIMKVRAIELSSAPRLHGFEGKSGAVWRIAAQTTEEQLPPAACVPLKQVIDLTARLGPDGRLSWDAPPGRWTILRMGHTPTGHENETAGGGRGLEVDKLNPDAVRLQLDQWFEALVRQVGPRLAERTLRILHADSWECGSQNWSPVFREEFRRRRTYDPLPYLPILAGVPIESADVSERFLRDVRATIAELVADNFYGTLAAAAKRHELDFSAESVAPTMVSDGMAHFAHANVPMGEYWLRSPTHDKLNDVLDAVSGARVYGHRIVQAEAFTEVALQWDETPARLKPLQDRNYALGVNRVAVHVMAHNPWPDRRPGMTLSGVGQFFQPDQTWWRPGRAWLDYTARCQALLQLGRPVVDIAVYTGDEVPRRAVVPWHLRSTLPGMVADPAAAVAARQNRILHAEDWTDPLHGYAYDSINRDALLRMTRLEEGRLVLPGGAAYPVLVVPAANPMMPEASRVLPLALERIREFAESGGTVILGERPTRSPTLQDFPGTDGAVRFHANALWPRDVPPKGEVRAVGRGRVVTGPMTDRNFERLGLAPDVAVIRSGGAPADGDNRSGIAWIHRAGEGWDLYFVSNQENEAVELTLSLRVAGRVPELWDPVTGDRVVAPRWRASGGRTEVPIRLAAAQSVFVVFRTPTTEPLASGPEYGTEPPAAQTIAGEWMIRFDPGFGGPSNVLKMSALASWTKQDDPRVRNYSGTASYALPFQWKPVTGEKKRIWLDLGAVRDVAEVFVNGTPCGVAWTAPYRVDVTQALRDGANELRVDVTNTWFNRLAGDRELPTAQRVTWTTAPDRTANKPLLDAGLLGPVTLRVEERR